jgi:LmbE family N-acetylglucosaminyl deacetylase
VTEQADILVVTPHPDDAEFGVAGTVARWTKQGKQVVYVVCTNGNKGTSDPNIKPEQLAEIRQAEQRAAAEVLGVREVVFLGNADQGLEDTPEFRKQIVRVIRRYRPETVVTADPYRRYIWHRDHRIAGQVTLDAVFPYARDHLAYPELLEEDITDTFELKLAALRCHESQVSSMKVSDLEDWLRQRCSDLAEGEDFDLAEAFHREEIVW